MKLSAQPAYSDMSSDRFSMHEVYMVGHGMGSSDYKYGEHAASCIIERTD